LLSFGFLLSQDLTDTPLEFVVTPTWRKFMVPIAELEALVDVRLPTAVRECDQAGTGSGESVRTTAGLEMLARPAQRRMRVAGAASRPGGLESTRASPAPVRGPESLSEGPLTFRDHFI